MHEYGRASCALTTALPGVLTDSARLGLARHTVRRSAAPKQTRREMRRGRLLADDYRTADPHWFCARAQRHSYAYGSDPIRSGPVRSVVRTYRTTYNYAPCQFNHSTGLGPPCCCFLLSSFTLLASRPVVFLEQRSIGKQTSRLCFCSPIILALCFPSFFFYLLQPSLSIS